MSVLRSSADQSFNEIPCFSQSSVNGKIQSIDARLRLENKDYKKTLKITWLAHSPIVDLVPVTCYHFDHIISKPILDKEEDFKQYCNHKTEVYDTFTDKN
jgi:hypothetical protein